MQNNVPNNDQEQNEKPLTPEQMQKSLDDMWKTLQGGNVLISNDVNTLTKSIMELPYESQEDKAIKNSWVAGLKKLTDAEEQVRKGQKPQMPEKPAPQPQQPQEQKPKVQQQQQPAAPLSEDQAIIQLQERLEQSILQFSQIQQQLTALQKKRLEQQQAPQVQNQAPVQPPVQNQAEPPAQNPAPVAPRVRSNSAPAQQPVQDDKDVEIAQLKQELAASEAEKTQLRAQSQVPAQPQQPAPPPKSPEQEQAEEWQKDWDEQKNKRQGFVHGLKNVAARAVAGTESFLTALEKPSKTFEGWRAKQGPLIRALTLGPSWLFKMGGAPKMVAKAAAWPFNAAYKAATGKSIGQAVYSTIAESKIDQRSRSKSLHNAAGSLGRSDDAEAVLRLPSKLYKSKSNAEFVDEFRTELETMVRNNKVLTTPDGIASKTESIKSEVQAILGEGNDVNKQIRAEINKANNRLMKYSSTNNAFDQAEKQQQVAQELYAKCDKLMQTAGIYQEDREAVLEQIGSLKIDLKAVRQAKANFADNGKRQGRIAENRKQHNRIAMVPVGSGQKAQQLRQEFEKRGVSSPASPNKKPTGQGVQI